MENHTHTPNTRLKHLRDSLKMSQNDFAKKIGITQSYLSAVEGGRKEVTVKMALVLFELFKVSLDWIFLGKEDEYMPNRTIGDAENDQNHPVPEGQNKMLNNEDEGKSEKEDSDSIIFPKNALRYEQIQKIISEVYERNPKLKTCEALLNLTQDHIDRLSRFIAEYPSANTFWAALEIDKLISKGIGKEEVINEISESVPKKIIISEILYEVNTVLQQTFIKLEKYNYNGELSISRDERIWLGMEAVKDSPSYKSLEKKIRENEK